MSKELNVIDTPVIETSDINTQPQIIKLDDLSLTLVGGGAATVLF